MNLEEIKNIFINFYKSKNHILVSPSSLVTKNDLSIMFTNSGMVQFKNIFLGIKKPKYKRVISIQRCLRVGGKHNDLENVGYTNRHHTFFEMLGNWSFGDYFKKETLKWSWELLTKIYKIPENRLLVTVYKKDKESYNIWINKIGISKDKILIVGDKKNIKYESDNFWQMAETGPCGPSSEIFYDYEENNQLCLNDIKNNNNRYIEICNNVFMEFNKQIDYKTNKIILKPLPFPCVDTGMGVERLATILQNVKSNYDIDIFKNIINYISKKIHIKKLNVKNNSLKIISDHLRSSSFLIMDGVLPNNEGPGYVLRKLIRRAIINGYKIGEYNIFFYKLVPILIKEMNISYPKLLKIKKNIQEILKKEEINFKKTIKYGLKVLKKKISKNFKTFNIKDAFKLYDTYGLPIYLILKVCKEKNIQINIEEFNNEMKKQKNIIFNKKK